MSRLYTLLGKNIAHFRRQAHLTQEQLAERTDYSVDFIGLVERGINAPTVARLENIAVAVGVDVWQLFHPGPVKISNGSVDGTKSRKPTRRSGSTRLANRERGSAA